MSNRARIIARIIVATAVAFLGVGCANDSGNCPQCYPCPQSVQVLPTLAYPEPGATDVPTAAGSLIFYGPVPYGENLALKPQDGGAAAKLGASGPAPSPLPSPLASPPPGLNFPLYGIPYSTLAPATTYDLVFSAADPGPCNPGTPYTSAHFTTL